MGKTETRIGHEDGDEEEDEDEVETAASERVPASPFLLTQTLNGQ